jgi:hypothetical protein
MSHLRFAVRIATLCLASFLFGTGFALATDNYVYGSDEYVTITDGISPNGRWAITAHGEGDYGYNNFHIFLTNALTGKTVGPLEQIADILDTGAGAYCALWAKDSQQVTIFWRYDRHEPLQEITFRVRKNRAFLMDGPKNVDKAYAWYWENHCGYIWPTLRTFGTPLPREKNPYYSGH